MTEIDYSKYNVKLVKTCGACPEQYDMYLDGEELGYFRLRHGGYSVEYLPTEEQVYYAHPKGDGLFDDDERDYYLKKGIKAIIDRHNECLEDKELENIIYVMED